MDFLDPKAKKKHAVQLAIGYILMGILISIATIILVFQAYGFDVNRKTGEVIQNGLVFVDSAPDRASLYLNDKLRTDQTNTRQTLPEGHYDMKIHKDGYRDWKRSFDLKGGSIKRFTYPLLIPNDLAKQEINTYDLAPTFSSESPDRRWLIVSKGASLTDFTEYDLNAVSKEKPAQRDFSVPIDLLSVVDGQQSIELVEWSSDNKHMLIKHNFQGGFEYVIVSRDTPDTSVNINKLLSQTPTTVTLRDKKFDQWYLYNSEGGVLQTADTNKTITPLLTGVGAYKTHDANTLMYTQPIENSAMQRVMIKQGKQTYTVREIPSGTVMLDATQYDNSWYVVIGSEADKKTYVYKDPFQFLTKNSNLKPAPTAVLRSNGPLSLVSFSKNARFIVAESGQHFEVYDAEDKQVFQYDVAAQFDAGTVVTWMDGHRLTGHSQKNIIMFDFDGSNIQTLLPSLAGSVTSFDRDYTVLYTFDISKINKDKSAMFRTDLRFAQDR